ncbi:hypothetical protein HO173_005064 [Letharia columbiana]|uniref:Uncharacterized protein n=1 Tax=Letharia columbiana TaxID=112416 RepID=A0A8H6FXZ1_9LECA|nr:uncharacterized protein HO173_005064 [Letharia columbiana]KAF6236773.1 hypothetical protein HO173_005064 [Letharia columbiana]
MRHGYRPSTTDGIIIVIVIAITDRRTLQVIEQPAEQQSLGGRAAREGQGSDEGEVNEDVGAEAPAGERAAEPVQEAEMMEFDEDMFNLDIGNLDDMDAFLASLEGGSF